MNLERLSCGALLAIVSLAAALAADPIRPEQAASHVGEHQTVCGTVASATYAVKSNGRPTFLNLGQPYPNHVFTAVVWGEVRATFAYEPEDFEGETICVTGRITTYRGKLQITVSDPSQIDRS
jgi:DNA/RNA endonuclease YhcR with UshA esterase domain